MMPLRLELAALRSRVKHSTTEPLRPLPPPPKKKQKLLDKRRYPLYRGSYMSAHVLLNLLNELGKRDKMRGLPSILSLFRYEFDKFNEIRALMLDSIYHMTNTLKSHFWR